MLCVYFNLFYKSIELSMISKHDLNAGFFGLLSIYLFYLFYQHDKDTRMTAAGYELRTEFSNLLGAII